MSQGTMSIAGHVSTSTTNALLSPNGIFSAMTQAEGRAVALHLKEPNRSHPTLVTSTPTEDAAPLVSVEEIYAAVKDFCDVVLLQTGAASFAFADHLPNQADVYGGAARSAQCLAGWPTDRG
jgi:hypothetical protein